MYIPEIPDNCLRERVETIVAYSRNLDFGDILDWVIDRLEECM